MSASLVARYSDGSGQYTIRRDGDVLWTEIDMGEWTETLASRLVPAEIDLDWSEWMLTDRFASCPDVGGKDGAVRIDGETFALEPLETTGDVEQHALRPNPYRLDEQIARHRVIADQLRRGAAAASGRADLLLARLATEPVGDDVRDAALAAGEISEIAWDRLFSFLDRTGLARTDLDPRAAR